MQTYFLSTTSDLWTVGPSRVRDHLVPHLWFVFCFFPSLPFTCATFVILVVGELRRWRTVRLCGLQRPSGLSGPFIDHERVFTFQSPFTSAISEEFKSIWGISVVRNLTSLCHGHPVAKFSGSIPSQFSNRLCDTSSNGCGPFRDARGQLHASICSFSSFFLVVGHSA